MGDETLDLDTLRAWIGRREEATDLVSERLAAEFAATFGDVAPKAGDPAPAAIHWCLAPRLAGPGRLGPDGHPERGDFLPPVSLPRRMWAGGEATFHAPILVGDRVTRSSRIGDVSIKSGRSGQLCFVTVHHDFSTGRGPAVTERHDIVYRAAAAAGARPAQAAAAETACPDHRREVATDPVLLFRYSAITFNGHRIHYDRDYATRVEGYDGLVVHGPLQMTLLIRYGLDILGSPPRFHLAYRGQRPVTATAMSLNATREGDVLKLWTAGPDGLPAMEATMRAA